MKTTLIIDRKFVFEFVIEVVSKMYGISDWLYPAAPQSDSLTEPSQYYIVDYDTDTICDLRL